MSGRACYYVKKKNPNKPPNENLNISVRLLNLLPFVFHLAGLVEYTCPKLSDLTIEKKSCCSSFSFFFFAFENIAVKGEPNYN